MCGINSGYHDVNISYYGRTMVHFNKTVRKIKFHHIKKEVVTVIFFTDVTDFDNINLHLHANSNYYYCQLNVKCEFLRDKKNILLLHIDNTLTGHFIRYTLLVPGWNPFCLQNCPNSSWYRFNKVLETFL